MSPVDRNLLLRIARRLEEQAEREYESARDMSDQRVADSAKRRRDRELGDAKDLRDYVKRMDTAQA